MTSAIVIFAAIAAMSAVGSGTPSIPDGQIRDSSFENAVLVLSGASCIEELGQEELEHYESLAEHPLDINLAGTSRLLSTGLFTRYQAAALLDYRERSGDILSFTELGLVDGFSAEFADALKPFVRLKTSAPPGSSPGRTFRQTATAGSAVRDNGQYTARIKYSAEWGETAEFRWTSRTTFSDPEFRPGTFSATYYGKRLLGKAVLGHFSARFGQGLAIWSGFSMSGFSSAASFRKRGSGISPTGSASAELFGIAAEWTLGSFSMTTGYSLKGNRIIGNLSWMSRNLTLGATATEGTASIDWQLSLPDISTYGEFCCSYKGKLQGAGGFIWVPKYGHKLAFLARWHDAAYKEYSEAALGWESPTMVCTADAACRLDKKQAQFKMLLQLRPMFTAGKVTISPKIRWSGRLRPSDEFPLRNDLRTDIETEWKGWTAAARFNALWCRDFGWLWYIQAGRKDEKFSLYLRGGTFMIDNWDDRIYVYQQDAPGNFNVPAFCGRGWNVSVYSAIHLGRHHSIWARLECVQYPWTPGGKTGKIEFRLQYRWRS